MKARLLRFGISCYCRGLIRKEGLLVMQRGMERLYILATKTNARSQMERLKCGLVVRAFYVKPARREERIRVVKVSGISSDRPRVDGDFGLSNQM